jgi:predicted adenine nucleotide alpha hydrolase (AANH) superfamily ATPase
MKLLLHLCCAPCTIYPLQQLRQAGHEISGLFCNPNIHPYLEYARRLETLKEYADRRSLTVIYPEGYEMEAFLRSVAFREADRCLHCYYLRLSFTAMTAKQRAFDGFTTTLLYSKFQKHEIIKAIGESLAKEFEISFYYQDFRAGWVEGVRISKEMGMYRQPTCGCIYSEKERYYDNRKDA